MQGLKTISSNSLQPLSFPTTSATAAPTTALTTTAPQAPLPAGADGATSTSRIKAFAAAARNGTLAGIDLGVEATKANLLGLMRGLIPFNGKSISSQMPILRPVARTATTARELVGATGSLARSTVTFSSAAREQAADAVLNKFLELFALDAVVNGPWAEPGSYHGAITGGASIPRKYGRLIGLSKNWTSRRPPEDMVDDWKRGMKRWHATSNAIIAANASISELVGAYWLGIGHEIDPASFQAELSGQGQGVWSDSVLDLAANIAGLTVGLLVGTDKPEVTSRLVNRFAELIPGPPDPFESDQMGVQDAKEVKRGYELATIGLFLDRPDLDTDEKVQAMIDSLPAEGVNVVNKLLVLQWDLTVDFPDGKRRLTADERDALAASISTEAEGNPAFAALLTKAQAYMDSETLAGRDPWFPEGANAEAPKTTVNLKKFLGELDDMVKERLAPLAPGGSLNKQITASATSPAE